MQRWRNQQEIYSFCDRLVPLKRAIGNCDGRARMRMPI